MFRVAADRADPVRRQVLESGAGRYGMVGIIDVLGALGRVVDVGFAVLVDAAPFPKPLGCLGRAANEKAGKENGQQREKAASGVQGSGLSSHEWIRPG